MGEILAVEYHYIASMSGILNTIVVLLGKFLLQQNFSFWCNSVAGKLLNMGEHHYSQQRSSPPLLRRDQAVLIIAINHLTTK